MIERKAWTVGETVRLSDGYDWAVRAVTDHFAALVRTITERDVAEWADWREEMGFDRDEDKVGDPQYTVVDWRNAVRGPCNLVGQAWGDGTYTEAECAAMLAEFEAGELEVSHRNRVPIDVVGEVR